MSNPADLETAKMFAQEELTQLKKVIDVKLRASQSALYTESYATAAAYLKSLAILANKAADYIYSLNKFDSKKEFERDGF